MEARHAKASTRIRVHKIQNMPITTHILDTSRGIPAKGVRVRLERASTTTTGAAFAGNGEIEWEFCGEEQSNDDGRTATLNAGTLVQPCLYRCLFFTGPYFYAADTPCFHPRIEVIFSITEATQNLHIPLLVSPFGYTTYKGS